METRANYVLIGAFTLAVIAAAFGFVLWFQSLHTTKQRSPIRIVFEGPASGLRNGGSVNFNGIRIGEVVSVKLDNPRRVVALAMVENNAPIRKDTLVGLEFQGLTGVAAISLKGTFDDITQLPTAEFFRPFTIRREHLGGQERLRVLYRNPKLERVPEAQRGVWVVNLGVDLPAPVRFANRGGGRSGNRVAWRLPLVDFQEHRLLKLSLRYGSSVKPAAPVESRPKRRGAGVRGDARDA